MKKSKKVLGGILIFLGCSVPMLFVTGCGCTDIIKCTWCGDSSNRMIFYASGTNDAGVEYQSCVGPAGCLGLGCNTKCIPTECMTLKTSLDNKRYTGTACYYDSFGCINGDEANSYVELNEESTCLGISCAGTKYVENSTDEKSEAYMQNTCLGASCGDKEYVKSRNGGERLQRQFPKGCWSCSAPEEKDTLEE